MKQWIGFVVLSILMSAVGFASPSHWRTLQFNTTSGPTTLTIDLMPTNPIQGQQVEALIQLTTGLASSAPVNALVSAMLDSSTNPLPLIHPSANAWIAELGVFSEISSHTLNVNLQEQDASAATTLQTAINTDNANILSVQDQINNPANASNPALLETLENQLATDRAQLQQDQASLAATLSTLQTQSLSFSVGAADPESSIYPHIVSVSPNLGSVGTPISISGSNYSSLASQVSVLIGGISAQVTSVSTSVIQAIIPAGLTAGSLVNIEVDIAAPNAPITNAVLTGGFYVLPAGFSSVPIAVISPMVGTGTTGAPITLSGVTSSGGIGALTYSWTVQYSPAGSAITSATNLGTTNSTTFTPDIGGTYVIGLTVTDAAGNISQTSSDIITVTQPASLTLTSGGQAISSISLSARAQGAPATQVISIQNTSNNQAAVLTPALTDGSGYVLSGSISLYQSDCATPLLGGGGSFTVAPSSTATICVSFAPTSDPNTTLYAGGSQGIMPATDQITVSLNGPSGALGSLTVNATAYQVFPFSMTQILPGPSVMTGLSFANPWTITNITAQNPQYITVPMFFDEPVITAVTVTNTSSYPFTVSGASTLVGDSFQSTPNLQPFVTTAAFASTNSDGTVTLAPGATVTLNVTVTPQDSSQFGLGNYVGSLVWDTQIDSLGNSSYFRSVMNVGVNIEKAAPPTNATIGVSGAPDAVTPDRPTFSMSSPDGQIFSTAVFSANLGSSGSVNFHGMLYPANDYPIDVTSMSIVGGNANCISFQIAAGNAASDSEYFGSDNSSNPIVAGTSFTATNNFWLGAQAAPGIYAPNYNPALSVTLQSGCYSSANETSNPTQIKIVLNGFSNPLLIPIVWMP